MRTLLHGVSKQAIRRAALRQELNSQFQLSTTNRVTMDIPATQPHATLNYTCNYVKRKEEVDTVKCNSKTFFALEFDFLLYVVSQFPFRVNKSEINHCTTTVV
jgi:hypothetical protein